MMTTHIFSFLEVGVDKTIKHVESFFVFFLVFFFLNKKALRNEYILMSFHLINSKGKESSAELTHFVILKTYQMGF